MTRPDTTNIHSVATPVLDYIRALYAPEDKVLQRVQQRIAEHTEPIHIGAEEGKLLQVLIRMADVKTIVEIGTLAGYSTLWMARALPEDGHIYTIEHDPNHAALAQEGFAESEVAERITLIEGTAQEQLDTLSDKGPFDMVFIDADKLSYKTYLDWAEEHIRKGGLIVADNTLLFGAVYSEELPGRVRATTRDIMRRFNARLADAERYTSILLPTEQGLTIAVKEF